jgi:hypothetical protein
VSASVSSTVGCEILGSSCWDFAESGRSYPISHDYEWVKLEFAGCVQASVVWMRAIEYTIVRDIPISRGYIYRFLQNGRRYIERLFSEIMLRSD